MTLIVDASAILAAADDREPLRDRVRATMTGEPGEIVVPAPVTAEIDYLLRRRLGGDAARAFLDDVTSGRIRVVGLTRDEHATARTLDLKYRRLELGLADASLVVLAHRFNTQRLLSLDQRHFRTVTTIDGEQFTLLPFDE